MEITFSLVGILTSVLKTTIAYPLMEQIEMLCLTDVVKSITQLQRLKNTLKIITTTMKL